MGCDEQEVVDVPFIAILEFLDLPFIAATVLFLVFVIAEICPRKKKRR